jgi:hypothetical protein
MRVKDVRGRPDIVSDLSGLAEYLPFHVELGCGPSLESGIPALHHLHDLYCVTDLQTGKFIFGGTEDNLIARILEQPFDELKSLTKLFQASFLAYASGEGRGVKRFRMFGEVFAQAAWARMSCLRQFHGRSSWMRLAGWSGKRASTSASQAWGSMPLSLAVAIRV